MSDKFWAVMCEQYGTWSFITGFKSVDHVERHVKDVEREIQGGRDYVKHLEAREIPIVPEPDAESGIWVCVFKSDDDWRITNGMKNRAACQLHVDNRLTGPNSKHISNITIRCLAYPESCKS